MKKQTHLHLGWPEGEYFFLLFHFWANYCFKSSHAFVGLDKEVLKFIEYSKRVQINCFKGPFIHKVAKLPCINVAMTSWQIT